MLVKAVTLHEMRIGSLRIHENRLENHVCLASHIEMLAMHHATTHLVDIEMIIAVKSAMIEIAMTTDVDMTTDTTEEGLIVDTIDMTEVDPDVERIWIVEYQDA